MTQNHVQKHSKPVNTVVLDSPLGPMRIVLSERVGAQAMQATGLANAAEAVAKLITDAPNKRFETLDHGDHERQGSNYGSLHLHLPGLQEPVTLRFDALHVRNAEQMLDNHMSDRNTMGAALVAAALTSKQLPVTARAIHERGAFLG